MVPGQYSFYFLRSQFRLCIQAVLFHFGVNMVVSNGQSVSCAMSQTSLEKGKGAASTVVSFYHNKTATNHSKESNISDTILKFSVLSVKSSLYDSSGALKSNPLTIKLSNIPTNSTSQFFVAATVQYSQTVSQLSSAYEETSSSFTTTCSKDDGSKHSYDCSDGDKLEVQCNYTAAVIVSRCPVLNFTSACNSILGSVIVDDSANDCKASQSTANNQTCTCPIVANTVKSNSLAVTKSFITSTSAAYSANYVSMLSYTKHSFVSTVSSVDSLNAATVSKSWKVLVTIGIFAVSFVVLMLFSVQWDADASKDNFSNIKKSDLWFLNALNKSILAYIAGNISSSARASKSRRKLNRRMTGLTERSDSDLSLVEESLPAIMSSKSLWAKIFVEFKAHHRWFSIFFHFSKSFPRPLRVLSLASNILSMLFIQSVTYDLVNPDTGYFTVDVVSFPLYLFYFRQCNSYKSQSTCVETKSQFATGESMCSWGYSSSTETYTCSFIQPDNSIRTILFVAILSAILSTPIAVSSTWLIKNILTSAPSTAADSKITKSNSAAENKEESDDSEENNTLSFDRKIKDTIPLKPQPELSLRASVSGVVAAADFLADNSDVVAFSGSLSNKPMDSSFDNVGSFHSHFVHQTFGSSNRIDKSKSHDDPALIQFVSLCVDIKKYRNNLKQEDKSEFDRKNLQWHLYFKLYVILHS